MQRVNECCVSGCVSLMSLLSTFRNEYVGVANVGYPNGTMADNIHE